MNNIVKGVVMNNKYLLLYKEYMLNNMYHLTNSNNRARANVCTLCCDDCNGSCISGNSSKYRLIKMFKYVNANAQNNALALPSPNALALPSPKAMSLLLCSKFCSENVHNDCICL
jgi:heterodisulfide reductase subunit C